MRRRLLAPAALWALAACSPPRCPPAPVTLPPSEGIASWLEPGRPRVAVDLGVDAHTALLDTGFPRSAADLSKLSDRVDLATTRLDLGGAAAGPLGWDPLLLPPSGVDLIIGADVLWQLPLVLDARAAATRVLRAFAPGAGAPLSRWSSGLCRGDDPDGGPEGPDLLLVQADLDGQPLTLAIDTGADMTIVRQGAVPGLSSRPTLSGLTVRSGFAGGFLATATRARSLSIGGQSSASAPVLLGPELDQGLDAFLQRYRGAPPRLDGFLGWSFLREFEVSLARGDSAAAARTLGLTRFDTQAHWTRDFVGIGVSTAPSGVPAGLFISSFLSVSPARDAGLQAGDVIVQVDGAPALAAPVPWGAPGDTVTLEVRRGAGTLTFQVAIADLLPDPG